MLYILFDHKQQEISLEHYKERDTYAANTLYFLFIFSSSSHSTVKRSQVTFDYQYSILLTQISLETYQGNI